MSDVQLTVTLRSKEIVRTVLEKLIDEFPDWDSQLSGLCNALTHEVQLLYSSSL